MTRRRRFAASAWHVRGLRRFAALARRAQGIVSALALLAAQPVAHAHSGPPFPIVTDTVRGPYTISIWTDPDATDDGSAGGQFWIVLSLSPKATPLPPETRVTVSVRAVIGRTEYGGPQRHAPVSAIAAPVRGDMGNQFAGLVMDHEGPYEVQVMIDGPLGPATIDSRVDATYDLRPPAYMLAWYLVPFLLAGLLWTRLILRRRKLPHKG